MFYAAFGNVAAPLIDHFVFAPSFGLLIIPLSGGLNADRPERIRGRGIAVSTNL